MFLSVFLSCLLLGACTGILAGLLGIGGGLIIVPALLYILPLVNITIDQAMPIALATSLASIIITSTSAVFSHHKNNNIPWQLTKQLLIFVSIGALLGSYLASFLSAQILVNIFAGAVIILATYMLGSVKFDVKKEVPSRLVYSVIGSITGVISSLMGIAGGAILVPTLTYFSTPMRKAIGVSTVCGVAIAGFATLGFVIAGFQQNNLPAYSFGYVYLPALMGIVITSTFFAKLGVKLATYLPVKTLKKLFALFLICVAINMLFS